MDELRFCNKCESYFAQLFLLFNLAAGVDTVSANATFGISVCGCRWRAPVLKHEWILNCATSTVLLGKERWRYIDQISPHLLPWFLEFILKFEIRIEYSETVPFCNFQTIPSLALFWNFLFKLFASQSHERRIPEQHADHPTPSTASVSWKVLLFRKRISLWPILMF